MRLHSAEKTVLWIRIHRDMGKQCGGSGLICNSRSVYFLKYTPQGPGGVLAEDTWGKNVKKREEEEGQIRKIKQKEKIDIKRVNKCKRGGK
jgi:hypothetical protein